MPSRPNRFQKEHHLCKARCRVHRILMNTVFFVQFNKLGVRPSPPLTIFPKILQLFFENFLRFMFLGKYRSNMRFVYGTFDAGVNLFKPQLLLELVVGPTSTINTLPCFMASVIISLRTQDLCTYHPPRNWWYAWGDLPPFQTIGRKWACHPKIKRIDWIWW